MLWLRKGDQEKAHDQLEQSLALNKECGHILGIGLVCDNLGQLSQREGHLKQAESMYMESLDLFSRAGHRPHMASAHSRLGTLHALQHDYESACTELELALDMFEEMDNRAEIARVCAKLGDVYFSLANEEEEKIVGMYQRALGVFQELGNESGRGRTYAGLGNMAARRGDAHQAIAMWTMASKLLKKAGNQEQADKVDTALRKMWTRGKVHVA